MPAGTTGRAVANGSVRMSAWGLVGALVAVVLTVLGSVSLFELQAAGSEVTSLAASVGNHHQTDEGRDAECKQAVAELMRNMQSADDQRNRMEQKIDRIAMRVGAGSGGGR